MDEAVAIYVRLAPDSAPYFGLSSRLRQRTARHRKAVRGATVLPLVWLPNRDAAGRLERLLTDYAAKAGLPIGNKMPGGVQIGRPDLGRLGGLAQPREAKVRAGRRSVELHGPPQSSPEDRARGGRIAGRKNVESGHWAIVRAIGKAPQAVRARIDGLARDMDKIRTKDGCIKGGIAAGRVSVESGNMARAQKLGASVGGSTGKAMCSRWHGRKNGEPLCSQCQEKRSMRWTTKT